MGRIHLKKQTKAVDRKILIISLILTTLGLIAIADASAPIAQRDFLDKFYFVKQQAVGACVGLLLLVICSRVKYTFWEKVSVPLFIGSIILLILVLVPSIGSKILGARRWLVIGPIHFQPSEFIKLTLAMYIAKLASRDKRLISYLIPVIITCILIMLQPDLGTVIVISGFSLVQIFISGISIFKIFALFLIEGISGILLIMSSSYRKDRLFTFIEQARDPLGKSYHIRQILLALGSGGLWGVGLGHSRQKYLFLPEAATDSIFPIIAEEIGFIGSAIVIFIFLYLILLGFNVAQKAPDKFSKILATGIVAWIGGQVFLNIGSMVALVPLTGVPLPFISYGGSSLVAILSACGILLNISKYAKEKD